MNPKINATELNAIIDNPNLRLLDCRHYLTEPDKGKQLYLENHIPNAQHADLDHQLAGPITEQTGRHPLPDKAQFQLQLQQWGIDQNSNIVVYDDMSGAIAARAWWMCIWAGLSNVAILDGGIKAWIKQGYGLTNEQIQVKSTRFRADFDDSLWMTTSEIQSDVENNNIKLVDARADVRFLGQQEPIDKKAGHVPGAHNLPFEKNLDEDGCFLSTEQLKVIHAESPADLPVVSMCGSGVTACHNMFARTLAGLDMGKLYVGSWSEWICNPNRSIESEDT